MNAQWHLVHIPTLLLKISLGYISILSRKIFLFNDSLFVYVDFVHISFKFSVFKLWFCNIYGNNVKSCLWLARHCPLVFQNDNVVRKILLLVSHVKGFWMRNVLFHTQKNKNKKWYNRISLYIFRRASSPSYASPLTLLRRDIQ